VVNCGKDKAKLRSHDTDNLNVEVVDHQPPTNHLRIAAQFDVAIARD